MLYSYQKATNRHPSPGKVIPRYLRLLPTIVSALGLGLVAFVAWPVANYQLSLALNKNVKNSSLLLNPVTYESFAREDDAESANAPTLIADIDYTKASNWFTFLPSEIPSQSGGGSQFLNLSDVIQTDPSSPRQLAPQEYSLAIPSLGIKQAVVKVNTDDLTKSLIQYRQTALPGSPGAPIIFGHSTLPQFFNPVNYLTVFSTLPTIKTGADIFVDYSGVQYTYRVSKTYEVKPNDVWILRQDYNQKLLKLVTCVPPGTKLRRLVVEAQLIKS